MNFKNTHKKSKTINKIFQNDNKLINIMFIVIIFTIILFENSTSVSNTSFTDYIAQNTKKIVKSKIKQPEQVSDSVKLQIQQRINKFVNPFMLFETEQETDSVFAYYTFEKGDTLEYVVHSEDSIVIDYDEPLFKLRAERIVIICDSVGLNNHYYLTYYLKDHIGKESKGDVKNIERKESNWVGKRVFLEIDSTGQRFNTFVVDSSEVIMAPGGSFQPHLIYPLGHALKKKQETWLMNGKYNISENGYPDAELKETTLHRMIGITDTMGFKTVQVNYVRTGTGDVMIKSKKNSYITSSVINSHGQLYINPVIRKPIHLYVTIEQKLKFTTLTGDTKVGSQHTNTYYTLFSYNKNKGNAEIQPKK
jgi:hypothetical protein